MIMISSRLEDYLEALFYLETTGQKQTVTALAEILKLTKGTIATVVKKMVEQELVLHESYGSIRLTPQGRRIGWQIYMKHERLKSFFHDFLGQDCARAEEIACLIEHHLDGDAAERFFSLIDYLKQAQENKLQWIENLQLSLNRPELFPVPITLLMRSCGRVDRLTGSDKINKILSDKGVVCGSFCENILWDKEKDRFLLTVDKKNVALDSDIAATVWII